MNLKSIWILGALAVIAALGIKMYTNNPGVDKKDNSVSIKTENKVVETPPYTQCNQFSSVEYLSYPNYSSFSKPNNKFGIYIYAEEERFFRLAENLVNSNGGDWGYVLIPYNVKDRDYNKWKRVFDDLSSRHLVPIIQLWDVDTAIGDSFVVVSAYADSADRATKSEVRLTDPRSLATSADALFIMAYDFHRPESANAGPVSPLGGTYKTSRLNLTTAIKSYLDVVPANKLILGLPFYGYDWVVEDASPMSTRIEGNDSIGFSKSISYAEVTDLLIKKQLKPLWDDIAKTPFINYIDKDTGSNHQIWYDNAESLKYKAELAQKNHFLGAGVWAVGYEGGYANLWNALRSQL